MWDHPALLEKQRIIPYRPAIDGLRAFAVLSVFVFHLSHKWLPGGFVGVDVFFVISGYLITSIILKDCDAGSFSLVKFYQRRIARIFPAFFTVALSTLVAAAFIYSPQDLASAGANLTAAALSLANLKFMSQGNYFIVSPDAQPFLHYWSLSVEEQFYMFFPLFFLLVFKFAGRRKVLVLSLAAIASLLACIILTRINPEWAFYLLPTRAWELLAGSLLSVLFAHGRPGHPWLSTLGLGLIILSFVLVHEGPAFPGYLVVPPVLGAVCVLIPPGNANGWPEKLLAAPPLVLIGRMSYSLYLWHWPVFSLIDYDLFQTSEAIRLALKITLSLLAAGLSFWLIEDPARKYLNQRKSRPMAYAALTATVALCVPLGIAIRRANYVNAELADVRHGGLVFDKNPNNGAVVLMGDSNGSMYGKVVKEICAKLRLKLTVISVAAGEPLPSSDGNNSQLWLDSLAVVQKQRPKILILACNWESKLNSDRNRLSLALGRLEPFADRVILLNQPPVLPEDASRAAIREGAHPPFFEDPEMRRLRTDANHFLLGFNSNKVSVVDIASHFQKAGGEVLYLDDSGRQLYHNADHLSGYGANLVKKDLISAMSGALPAQ